MKIMHLLENAEIAELDRKYPVAGPVVNGLHVTPEIANMGSIKSSLDDYIILKGVRVLPMDAFDLPEVFPSRIHNLADQINESKTIMPLIVVIDDQGPYILEGSHRIDALKLLGVKEFPALVVIDKSEQD